MTEIDETPLHSCTPLPPSRRRAGLHPPTRWACVLCGYEFDRQGDDDTRLLLPGEPGWAGPVVQAMARRIEKAVEAWIQRADQPADPRHQLVREIDGLLQTALRDGSKEAELLMLSRWLVDAADGTDLHAQLKQLPELRLTAFLDSVDGEVVYQEPTLGPITDLGVTVAEVLGSGILGNSAYDMVKAAARRFVHREGATTGETTRKQEPLSRSEAVTLALAGIGREWPELADLIPKMYVLSEKRAESGAWRVVLSHSRQIFTVIVPPGQRDPARLAIARHRRP